PTGRVRRVLLSASGSPGYGGRTQLTEAPEYPGRFTIEQKEEAVAAFSELGIDLLNAEQFVRRVKALSKDSHRRSLAQEDWEKVEVDGQVYAWNGPLEKFSDGEYKPIARDKYDALRNMGLQLRCCDPHKPEGPLANGYSFLYSIDFRWQRKHKLLTTNDQQVLMAKRQPKTGQ
ncbi:MAG: hypothetical protein ACYC7J_13465, partial [Syntrophales bacterium]